MFDEALKLEETLQKFFKLYPPMPLTYILTLLWVYRNEGKHQNDLEQYLGMSNATASRCVKWWGRWKDKKKQIKGLEFVISHPDPKDERYRVLYLTEEGNTFVRSLLSQN